MEKEELLESLTQFRGTEHYYKFSGLFRNVVLTDGAMFLAKSAGAYWLMDVVASHLPAAIRARETFAIATLKRNKTGSGAVFVLQDDIPANRKYATQRIPYTDFPLETTMLYVSFDGARWVVMLPSEY